MRSMRRRAIDSSRCALAALLAFASAACSAVPAGTLVAPRDALAPTTWASSRLQVGYQEMTDDDYWEVAGERFALGLETAFESKDAVFGGEGGFLVSHEDDSDDVNHSQYGATELDIETKTIELYGGWHRTFLRESRVRPYVGFGLALLWSQAEETLTSANIPAVPGVNAAGKRTDVDRTFALGTYAHAGVFVQVNEWLQLGVDLRGLASTEADLREGNSGDLGYTRVALFVGMGR